MIDWKKEIANVNYCGYCNSIISVCNGECWKDKNNRRDHLIREFEKAIKRLDDIEREIRRED